MQHRFFSDSSRRRSAFPYNIPPPQALPIQWKAAAERISAAPFSEGAIDVSPFALREQNQFIPQRCAECKNLIMTFPASARAQHKQGLPTKPVAKCIATLYSPARGALANKYVICTENEPREKEELQDEKKAGKYPTFYEMPDGSLSTLNF